MSVHPYNDNSTIYNILFHPFHNENNKTIAIITNIFLTIFTGFLWQIPFWIVNRLDNSKLTIFKENTNAGSITSTDKTGKNNLVNIDKNHLTKSTQELILDITYKLFKKEPNTVYGCLQHKRESTSFRYQKGNGGAASVAYDIYQKNKSAKIAMMLAANSGLPGGMILREIKPNYIPDNYIELLTKAMNLKTQEESVLAACLLSGIAQQETEKEKKNYLAQALNSIHGKWGFNDVGIGTNTMTIQGINFTTSEDANDYAHAHSITGTLTTSALEGKSKSRQINSSRTCPIHQLVFADSVNANSTIGRETGSMKRTLNNKAINDYSFFKDCVRNKLRASLDAMAAVGTTHALIATLSTGIYAGQHQEKIKQDFPEILQEVLDEEVTSGYKRGQYFEEVVIPNFEEVVIPIVSVKGNRIDRIRKFVNNGLKLTHFF